VTELPRNEQQTWEMSVFEANDMAGVGEVDDGHRCLEGGLARALELEEDGEPWGPELVTRYRNALAEYEARWGAGPRRN